MRDLQNLVLAACTMFAVLLHLPDFAIWAGWPDVPYTYTAAKVGGVMTFVALLINMNRNVPKAPGRVPPDDQISS